MSAFIVVERVKVAGEVWRFRSGYRRCSIATHTTAAQSGNYSVCLTWACNKKKLLLLDVLRRKVEFPELRRLITSHADRWEAGNVIIEAVGVGKSLHQELQRLDPERYLASSPKDSKEDRLMKVSPMIEAGLVWLPENAPWLLDFLREIESFPMGKYDDQVDALSQSLKWLHRWRQQSEAEIMLC